MLLYGSETWTIKKQGMPEEQVNLFNYLGNISYEKELGIDNKLHNYLKITGI